MAELNLAAGRINRGAAAFTDAWRSFSQGLLLLPSDGWQTHYVLTLALHVEAAGVAPLVGQPVAPLAEPVLAHPRTALDATEAHRSLILAAAAEGEFDEALRLGNRAGRAGREAAAAEPLPAGCRRQFYRVRLSLRGKSMADLRNTPRTTDHRAIAADRILSAILESLQVRSRDLPIAMAALRIVRRSQAVGRSPIGRAWLHGVRHAAGRRFGEHRRCH